MDQGILHAQETRFPGLKWRFAFEIGLPLALALPFLILSSCRCPCIEVLYGRCYHLTLMTLRSLRSRQYQFRSHLVQAFIVGRQVDNFTAVSAKPCIFCLNTLYTYSREYASNQEHLYKRHSIYSICYSKELPIPWLTAFSSWAPFFFIGIRIGLDPQISRVWLVVTMFKDHAHNDYLSDRRVENFHVFVNSMHVCAIFGFGPTNARHNPRNPRSLFSK